MSFLPRHPHITVHPGPWSDDHPADQNEYLTHIKFLLELDRLLAARDPVRSVINPCCNVIDIPVI